MPNPDVSPYIAGEWHLVATGVSAGGQLINHTFGRTIQATYRVSGDLEPTDLSDGVVFAESVPIMAKVDEPIDIYIYPLNGDAVIEVDI